MGVLRFQAFLHVFLNIIGVMQCNEAYTPVDMRTEMNDHIDALDYASDLLKGETVSLKGMFLKM